MKQEKLNHCFGFIFFKHQELLLREYILTSSCTFSPPCDAEMMLLCVKQWLELCNQTTLEQSSYSQRLVLDWFHTESISPFQNTSTVEENSKPVSAHETIKEGRLSFVDKIHHSKMQIWACWTFSTNVRWTCLCLVSLMAFQTCQAITPTSKQGRNLLD